jgi:hypothetical protein
MGITHGKTEVYEIYLPTWRKEIIWEKRARFSALKRRFNTLFCFWISKQRKWLCWFSKNQMWMFTGVKSLTLKIQTWDDRLWRMVNNLRDLRFSHYSC